MLNTKKVRYIGTCQIQTKYGKFKPGEEFEVSIGDYYALISTDIFEPVVRKMIKRKRNVKIFKKEDN